MITFNSNNIIVGYIKEFLASFNLPKYKNHSWIGTDANNYYYNKYIPNITKNLKITSNIYDTYTHEYLGQYLRFLRDFKQIDLLPLYNCFSNNICDHVKFKNGTKADPGYFIFDSNDTNYKIYMVPVLFNKEYTFAIDSFLPIEICYGIFGDHQNSANAITEIKLPAKTYKRFNSLSFSNPVLLTKLVPEDLDIRDPQVLYSYEQDLKLFLKVPISNNSSIVILEGNYLAYNDGKLRVVETDTREPGVKKYSYKRVQNYCVTNFAVDEAIEEFNPITPLQLLRMNTTYSYPFSDRLVEYLLDNAITSDDQISDNITRAQKVISLHYITHTKEHYAGKDPKGKDIWTCTYSTQPIEFEEEGLWENKIRPIIYRSMQKDSPNNNDINHDILGYIDKDAEKFYTGTIKNKDNTKTIVSIANIDLYSDMYKDSKEY